MLLHLNTLIICVYTCVCARVSVKGITSLTEPQVIYSRKIKKTECDQLNCHNARFGYALASIGDVNWDGFPG